MAIISIDTETTGLDVYHNAKPYFVTICSPEGKQQWWEWRVNPLTREPQIPPKDIEDILQIIKSCDELVLQNSKFDVAALASIGILVNDWPWDCTHDTLIAGHVLSSNHPHNLTVMSVEYLGIDIQHYEDKLDQCVGECRRKVQQDRLRTKRGKEQKEGIGDWIIAEKGLNDNGVEIMPSAKDKCWKYDMWLPLTMANHFPSQYLSSHHYRTVLRNYSNADSTVTIGLWCGIQGRWKGMEDELKSRGLWKIYLERLKAQKLAYILESKGVTYSEERLKELSNEFKVESSRCAKMMVNVAKGYNYSLQLPKGSATNKSLRTFLLDVLSLSPQYNKKSKTSAPTLNKEAMDYYCHTLLPRSKELLFVSTLLDKREVDTAVGYMDAYKRFGLPYYIADLGHISKIDTKEDKWSILHPSFNTTGTDTLRWSSSNPNSQNISKQKDINVRYCFGPTPGREWWSLDFQNLELRIPAYESGEKDQIELFEHPNDPPYYGSNHLLNFSIVYPDIWEEAVILVGTEKVGSYCKEQHKSTWYQWCKNGDFAVQYGAGNVTADATFRRKGSRAKLISKFSKLEALTQRCIRFAEKHGYIETLPDITVDRERGYPLLCSRTEWGGIKPTIPLSYRVQGTAMWLTHRAMVRCQDQLDKWKVEEGFDGFITLQVHDELDFDFPRGEGNEPWHTNLPRIKVIKELMEQGGRDLIPFVPTPVGVTYHSKNWRDGVEIKV